MTTSLRKQFSTSLASALLKDIQYQKSIYYYFLGKLEQWGATDTPPISVQSLSEAEDIQIRNNSAYFKRITPNDVTLVCPRYDWTSGTLYPQWDNTLDMDGQQFFVLTTDNRVYKCLNNNFGALSTVKPTGNPLQPFTTADGYLWKYMYTVPTFKRSRFVSVNYIPVQRALTDSFYNRGAVDTVTILNGGTGYIDAPLTFITVGAGTTTGSGAAATFTRNASGGIETISVTNGGSGYTKGVRVVMNSTVGENAVLLPVISAGVVTSVTILNAGVGYQATDSISFVVGGAVLVPSVSRSTGSIVDVKIIDAGAGYLTAPTLTASTMFPATVDGLYTGNSTAILESIVDAGSIQRVLIRDPGIGYPAANDTQIIVSGDGTGLSLTPVILDGTIVDIIVEDPGVGYTNLTLSVVGAGTGAILRPVFSDADYNSDQSVVEQVAVDGAIYAVAITNQGTGYTNTTVAQIIGDGNGATATVTVLSGKVVKVNMTSFGQGYTRATVVITDPARNNAFNEFVDAVTYAILPPGNGHGVDAVNELFGKAVAISSAIRSDPILTQYGQDYRQFGILHSPRNQITNKVSTTDFTFNTYRIQFNNTIGMIIDEVLLLGTLRYRVVYINDIDAYLQPLQKTIADPMGTFIAENDIARQYISSDVIESPIINKYSGELMYVSNENPFEFSDTQGLLVKTYIQF